MPTSDEITLSALPAFGEQIAREVMNGDYTAALKKIAVAAKADFKERFVTQTAPDGTPWAPIRGFRIRSGNGEYKPLQDKGLLRASASAQGQGHVEDITAWSMEVGTNLFYAATHQQGVPSEVWDGYPRRARALTIPLTLEAMRSGGARNMAGLELIWPKGRTTGWLVEKKWKEKAGGGLARGAKSILHFMLVPKVTIPARRFVGWSPKLLEQTDDILARRMQELASGAD